MASRGKGNSMGMSKPVMKRSVMRSGAKGMKVAGYSLNGRKAK